MIWMQDVAYTDYIYWQETNSFINGVASSSQNIELFFDKKVDRDSSLVIYDGKQVDLSHDHIYIDVQKGRCYTTRLYIKRCGWLCFRTR